MPKPSTSSRQSPVSDIPNSLQAKIVEQGVTNTATYEQLLGSGKDLWADDAEFERFLNTVQATRDQTRR